MPPGAMPPGAMPGAAPETSPYGGAPGSTGGAPGSMGGPSPGATTGPGTMGPAGGMTPPTGAEPSAPGGTMTGEPSMVPQQGTPGMTGSSMDVSSLDDAQLAAVLQSINIGEMQAAQLAVAQGSSPEVKRFAKEMLSTHRQMQSHVSSVLSRMQMTPSENAVSNQVKADGQNEMSMLQGEHGKDFDRDYIDGQVRDHNHALELVDRMIASAKSPDLKMALQNMRTKVETHLSEAERIQSSLQKGQTNKQRKSPAGSTSPSKNPSTNPSTNPY
jgi:putative membrane protein